MNFVLQLPDNEKENREKQNYTESEQSDSQNSNSQHVQKQNPIKLTSINKISTYLQFICQTKNFNDSFSSSQVSAQHQFTTSLETILSNLQMKAKQNQNLNEGTNEVLLNYEQHKIISDFTSRFKIDIEKKILSRGKFKKSTFFTKKLLIHDIFSSKSHEILKIQIQLMQYQTEICILNELGCNPLFQCSQAAGSGAFGNVYFTKIFEDFLAVKCITIENLEDDQKTKEFNFSNFQINSLKVMNVLQEFFFVLLFSELQIGPQVKTIGGFDLVIYQDSIAFATEICSKSRQVHERVDLKPSLFRMHMLQVVHRDIKPANIMFSETYKKNVFIDFGCTQILDAKIGEKSVTDFVGTTSFCSEEVLLLLTNKKKSVDLYFNDVFGLEKYMIELKSSCIIIKEFIQNISETYDVELISLKHSFYLQDYEKFNLKWKLIRKKYPQNLEEIQKRLLYFFKDLKPNENLRKFYWESIQQDTKEFPEYKDLEIVFKNERSKLLFYLNIDRSKIDAFQMRKILFKQLKIKLSDMTSKQKNFEFCMIHRVAIKKEISTLLSKISKYNFEQKEIWNNIRDDFQKLCIIVCEYSSLLQDSYEVSNEQKIKMCRQVLSIAQKIQNLSLNESYVVFKCPIQLFEPVSQFYQYFLFKIFPSISRMYRQRTLIQIISNISLLGYPLNRSSYVIFLLNYLLFLGSSAQDFQNISDDERIQRINNYWECKNCLLLFNNMQYQRNISGLPIKLAQHSNQQLLFNMQKFMTPKKDEKQSFFEKNFTLYNSIITQFSYFNQNKLDDLIQILNSTETLKSNKFIKKWKKLVIFSLSYLSTACKLKNKSKILKLLQNQKIFQSQEYHSIFPFLIYFYLRQMMQVKIQIHQFSKTIDQVTKHKDLSLRFELQYRFITALENMDFKVIKEIIRFITKQFSSFSYQEESIAFIKNILSAVLIFFNSYLSKIPNINEQLFTFLHICYPLLSLGMRIGMNYLSTLKDQQFNFSIFGRQKNQFIEANLKQIQNELAQRQFIKFFTAELIQIGKIYMKINEIAEVDETSGCNYLDDNKIKTNKLHPKKVALPNQDIVILTKLQHQIEKFDSSRFWIDFLYQNKNLRQQLKKNRYFANNFAGFILNKTQNNEEIQMCQQIIKELFDQISIDKFDHLFGDFNLPTFSIVFQYILIQLKKSKYDLSWCRQMVNLYQACWQKKFMKELINRRKSLRYIFNCLVYLKASFKEIKTFLSRFCHFLKEFPNNNNIQNIDNPLFSIFWCECIDCFPRKPQGWDQYAFSYYLSSTINEEKEIQNPYMSMVYYYNMISKDLPMSIYHKFVVSILKSLNHVVFVVRQIIMQSLYFFVIYSMYNNKILQNNFITIGYSRPKSKEQLSGSYSTILFVEKNFQNFVTQMSYSNLDQSLSYKIEFRKITMKEKKNQSNQRLFYYYGKMIKNQCITDESLQDLIQKRFFKEECIQCYRYPHFVKQAYSKKVKRYHEINQNYKKTDQLEELSKLYSYTSEFRQFSRQF